MAEQCTFAKTVKRPHHNTIKHKRLSPERPCPATHRAQTSRCLYPDATGYPGGPLSMAPQVSTVSAAQEEPMEYKGI